MRTIGIALISLALVLVSAAANAQAPTRVRGTISAVSGDLLEVKSRDGKDLKVKLAPEARIGTAKAITLADLKSGTYVGVTAMKSADGRLVAVEVHTIPPQAPAGQRPWDLLPGATMTNANLAGVAKASGGNEITLEYQGGSQKILVPDGATIATSVPADRSALKPGETIFAVGRAEADGTIVTGGVTVSKDDFKPPQ